MNQSTIQPSPQITDQRQSFGRRLKAFITKSDLFDQQRIPTTIKGNTSRTEIINHLIRSFHYQTYLEIGVRRPEDNFNSITIASKESVDPDPLGPCTYVMTSDRFFEQNTKTYDIIFIDGLHLDYQVAKDIDHALHVLKPKGTIVMHDCNPLTEFAQRETYEVAGRYPAWNGTTWKAYARLRLDRPDLDMVVVDTDHGCGLIRRGSQPTYPKPASSLDFAFLEANRVELLHLISVAEFFRRFKKTDGHSTAIGTQ